MLRFSKWPPQKGEIYWAAHGDHVRLEHEGERRKPHLIRVNDKEYEALFYNVGVLLAANIDEPTPAKVLDLVQSIDASDFPACDPMTGDRVVEMSIDPQLDLAWESVLAGAANQIRHARELQAVE